MKRKFNILFATFPGDGHVNPLTGIAVQLKEQGHDVRWYTSSAYLSKMNAIGIKHYPMVNALEIDANNLENIFPERNNHKSQLSKLKFDIINVFIHRGPEYFEDLEIIYKDFKFDLAIADVAFTAVPMIREVMNIPVITASILPLCATSKDLGPYGLGLTPKKSFMGRIQQSVMRYISDMLIFKRPFKVLKDTLGKYGISPEGNLFDTIIRKSNIVLQSGTPGFDYFRSDMSSHIHFAGPMMPYNKSEKSNIWYDDRLAKYETVILVTQGTVEKNVEKIIIPTLEAYKETDKLIIATTGGSSTDELRKKYPYKNIIIEDFIPFNSVMPYADVYVTNGGYGGVMLSIQNELPMVAAGVHEGKNEICARIGYFELGINLKTETPSPAQIKRALEKILSDSRYKENVKKLAREFSQYQPGDQFTFYIDKILNGQNKSFMKPKEKLKTEAIY